MCADCSYRQSQHLHTVPVPVPASSSASLALLDVLHEVPALPELLTIDAQKALSAASTNFRACFVAQVQIVTVTRMKDLYLITKCKWPLLNMVIHPTGSYYHASPIYHPRVVAHIYLSAKNDRHAVISLLRPLHTPASDLAWVSTAAQQLANQMDAKWPALSSFGMGDVRLDAMATAIIAQLAKGEWPSLRYLGLSRCRLGARGMLPLSEGKWSSLQVLDLSCNWLDAEGIALLAKGNWPLLEDIQLNANPALDAVAIAHLSAANWPLQNIDLSYMPFTSAMAAELAKLQLPSLTRISLSNTDLTSDAARELTKADWPLLSYLCLKHSDLDAGAIHHLCMMHLPALTILSLTHANIAAEAVYWLSLCSWPLLKDLDLSYNQLDDKDVKQLATGVWPNLQLLALVGNPFGHCGLQQLIKGDWPLLRFLDIGLNMLEMHDTAVLMGLDPARVQELRSDAPESAGFLPRSISASPADAGLWPRLTVVMLSNKNSSYCFFK